MSETVIRIRDLTKRFPGKNGTVTALDRVSLEIRRGEIYGIIGMSGAGKSTLVRCMNFLERPTEGTVSILGHDLGELGKKELTRLRKNISMIFQHFNLLMQSTTLENIMFPMKLAHMPRTEAREKALKLLKTVGLEDKADAYPVQLSGGQKQRVAIARALATDPQIILCDEATSALDPMTTRQILALLKQINREFGITVVIITHEMAVIREICSRVAVMEQSNLVEEGTVEEVFSHPKTKAAFRLIYPGEELENAEQRFTGKAIRIVFSGQESTVPVVAQGVLQTGALVSIFHSNLQQVGEKVFGQMALTLPEDPEKAEAFVQYVKDSGLIVEEVKKDV